MRIDYSLHARDVISELRTITRGRGELPLSADIRALVETRVSQINGCVYCVHLHLTEARKLGVPARKLDTLVVWRESPFFDERERAALTWAESLTAISAADRENDGFEALRGHFGDDEIVALGISVSLANFWNRMAAGFRRIPGD